MLWTLSLEVSRVLSASHLNQNLLFCNLSVSDIIGSTHLVPRLLSDILRPPSERLISYYECVVQAFTTQMFGTTSHTVLMIMAFDRYVAICNPLRYSAIMTNKMVVKLTVSAWAVAFVLVGVLLGLTVRLSRCRTMIRNPFCDNASLFKLSCESVFVNNVYGLTFTVVLLASSIGSMVLTYTKITVVCVTSKNQSVNSKALKTCSTHLMVYLIMVCSGMIIIILHRFPQYSDYRKLSAILFVLVPGSLNPVIYGVQSKEIRRFLCLYLIMLISGMILIVLHRYPELAEYRKIAAILFNVVPGSMNPVIYGLQSQEIHKCLSSLVVHLRRRQVDR